MPRKKDGMLIELLPRPTTGEDGKPLLYARPAIGFKYTIRAIDDFCNKYRGMSSGDMIRLFECFLDVATTLMRDGSRVETPIGSFAPKLKLDGDYTDPTKVKSKNVSLASIEFIPSKRFQQLLDEKNPYGYRRKPDVVKRHPQTDPDVLEATLQLCLRRGYTTTNRFAATADLKYQTAKRYLDGLCMGEKPRLRRFKEGTAYHYEAINK